MPRRQPIERVWALTTRVRGGHRVWTGAVDAAGRPVIGAGGHIGQNLRAQRLVWLATHGRIPRGFRLASGCQHELCLAHMELRPLGAGRGVWQRESATAKLTMATAVAIRRRFARGESRAALAAAYGVSVPAIRSVVLGHSWTITTETTK